MMTCQKIVVAAALITITACGGDENPVAPTPTFTVPSTPTPTAGSFGAGQHLIGTDIAPGRYYSAPASGCYWERQSGLGGTFDEILANELILFAAGQWIVDILASDVAFETNAECGAWFTTMRRGWQPTIMPGLWLGGDQVSPGTYRAEADDGCYWERLRGFTGAFSELIANKLVSSAGAQFVTIDAADAGFSTSDDCGTWTRVADDPTPVAVPDVVGQAQATAEATIVAAGLVVGTVTTAPSATVPAGDVISQSPTGGTSVPPGSAVDLVISTGPTPLQQIEYRLISQHLAFVDQVNYRAAEGERQETNVDFPWTHSMSVPSGTAVWMKATKVWLGPSCFQAELWVDGEIKSIDEQCGSGTASVSFP